MNTGGLRLDMQVCRPISTIPFHSKIIDNIVHKQIVGRMSKLTILTFLLLDFDTIAFNAIDHNIFMEMFEKLDFLIQHLPDSHPAVHNHFLLGFLHLGQSTSYVGSLRGH